MIIVVFHIFSVANLFCTHFPICHQDSRIAHFLHKWSHYPNHKPIYSNIEFKDPFSTQFPSLGGLRIDVRCAEQNRAIILLLGNVVR